MKWGVIHGALGEGNICVQRAEFPNLGTINFLGLIIFCYKACQKAVRGATAALASTYHVCTPSQFEAPKRCSDIALSLEERVGHQSRP